MLKVLLVLTICLGLTHGLDNGLGLTPPMGWLTWLRYMCKVDCNSRDDECINETLIMRMAKELVEGGWKELGYDYIMIDDCWAEKNRDPKTSRLVPDARRFPRGMKFLADYVHKLGLKFGLYFDFGVKTCAGYPGQQFYMAIDTQTIAEWKVDYIKIDACYSSTSQMMEGFRIFSNYIQQSKRPIYIMCEHPIYMKWYENPSKYDFNSVAESCNSWRTYMDMEDNWSAVMKIADVYEKSGEVLQKYAKPGQWNDPDMLTIGNFGLSEDQSIVQMSLWCIWSAPLIMSTDLHKIPEFAKNILQNKKAIKINQDSLGNQGRLVSNKNMVSDCKKATQYLMYFSTYIILPIAAWLGTTKLR